MRRLFLAAALVSPLLWAAAAAIAEDVSPDANKAQAAKSAEGALAGEIGRDLLSLDAAVRSRAVKRLLARIEKGGDLAAFLDAMAKATSDWASRHERLLEVWVDQAVNGKAEERERAVRLLTALGEKAIRRLALELRHRSLHGPQARQKEPASGEGAGKAASARVSPRIYDLKDLSERGMNALAVLSLLRKAANAVEVQRIGGVYVVTAEDGGHDRLEVRLQDLRKQAKGTKKIQRKDTGKEAAGAVATRPQPVPAPQQPAPADADPKGAPQAGAEDSDETEAKKDAPVRDAVAPGPGWSLQPLIFHVPRAASTLVVSGTATERKSKASAQFPIALRPGQTDVHTGTVSDAGLWTRALRTVPDARSGLPFEGPKTIRAGAATCLFAGKQVRFSQRVEHTKGGAWRIVTGTIQHGVELTLTPMITGPDVRFALVAARTDVGRPIPSALVRPSPKAAPVELERPEWSTTRTRTSFSLPAAGGGAFISLGGLSHTPDDHLVLVLSIAPADAAQQSAR